MIYFKSGSEKNYIMAKLNTDQKLKLVKSVDELLELFKKYYVLIVRNSKCGSSLMMFMKLIKGESRTSFSNGKSEEEIELMIEEAKNTLKNPSSIEQQDVYNEMKRIVLEVSKIDAISDFLQLLMKKENKEYVSFLVELLIPNDVNIEIKNTSQSNHAQEWDLLMGKVKYPSTKNLVTNIANLKTYRDNINRINRDEVKKYLLSINKNAIIIENPYLIYSYRMNNQYRPDLLIKTEDDRNVLVLCLPPANMAITYNQRRYRELDLFCKENGYGYLIMDSDGMTLDDVKSTPMEPYIEEKLNEMLRKTGSLYWDEVKEFKTDYHVSSLAIFAYILRNRLHFTLKPYCISDPVRKREIERNG